MSKPCLQRLSDVEVVRGAVVVDLLLALVICGANLEGFGRLGSVRTSLAAKLILVPAIGSLLLQGINC